MGEILELYKILEEVVGAEKAKRATEAIESLISAKREDLATKADIQELKTEIEKVKSELLKWMIVLFVGQATFVVGLVFTLIKLLR